MARSTYSTPVGQVYGESTALATTLAYGDILGVRRQFKGLQIYCASSIKFLTTPRIGSVILYDDSEGSYTDFTSAATDNDTTTHINLGTMTTADKLYIGAVDEFLGLAVNMNASLVNAASVTTVDMEYLKQGTWTDVSTDSDGTQSTNTLAQDGLYAWAIPATGFWGTTSPSKITNGVIPNTSELYYVRFSPAGTLTANTSIEGLITINKGTNYITWPAASPQEFNYDEDKVGGLQFLAVSGTPTVYVNHIEYKG